ncbi:DUF4132 domain-containing protein [Spirillospora sp. CA-255316]
MDEDVEFGIPDKWRGLEHPRRGTPVEHPVRIDPEAAEAVREMTRAAEPVIEMMLGHSDTDPGIAKAVRAWLEGEPDPVGAAAVASIVVERTGVEDGARRAAFADAWATEHGLPFAACAFTELVGVQFGHPRLKAVAERLPRRPGFGVGIGVPAHERHGALIRAASPDGLTWWWGEGPFMRRLRTLLATAGDEEYREAVRRLAAHRGDGLRRLAVTYLVPTEREWADECLTEDRPHLSHTTHVQIFCSLSTAEHAADVNAHLLLSWDENRPEILATLLHGGGTATVPVLSAALGVNYRGYAQGRSEVLEALARVPSDEALRVLVEQTGVKEVLPWVSAAAERFPEQAIRVLAQADGASTTERLTIEGLLRSRVHADPELAKAVLPTLTPEGRKAVEPLLPVAAVPDAADLPPLLADPPWTRRARDRAKPVVLDGLTPPAASSRTWEPGERELYEKFIRYLPDWANEPDTDWAAVETWASENMSLADLWLPAVVARFGDDAMPLVLRVVTGSPVQHGATLVPCLDADVARTMAGWLARLKSAGEFARRWLRRHGVAAVPYLVPVAFGKTGPERRGAESALRLLAEEHGEAAVAEAAGEAGQAVRDVLAVDPLEILPARIPKTDWADPAQLPRVLLRGRESALPAAATRHVLTMLAMSAPDEPYAGVDVVRELCDPVSLAEFSWAVFLCWQGRGAPTKDNWALTQLGLLGDDTTVRRLAPIIRAWPGEKATARAETGLDVLARIGSDVALNHLHALARKGKYAGVKAQARAKISEIAAARGLTSDELADRAVPDFGLDAEGGMTFDYGPRRFAVGFDEQLRPHVVEENGRTRKSLPKPGPGDDPVLAPAAHTLFAGLRRDVKAVAVDEIRRLETAMVRERRWSLEEFRRFFVTHPLLWHIVRRLVWLAEDGAEDGGEDGGEGGATAFRIAEDRTFADVNDDAVEPPASARIRIAHPVRLGRALGAWSELFADYEILQPFPQLGRPVHLLTEEERAATRLPRLEGRVAPYGKVKGLSQSRYQDWVGRLVREDLGGRYVIVHISPGLGTYYAGRGDDQTITAIGALPDPRARSEDLPLGEIDPVTMSEVIADILRISD